MNKRRCPRQSCRKPLDEKDDALLQKVIDTSYNGESVTVSDTEHELSCGHKVSFGASNIQGDRDFWLVPRG